MFRIIATAIFIYVTPTPLLRAENSIPITIQIELLKKAFEARKNAYAPISHYHVGAAVLTSRGIFTGTNVENSSRKLTAHAEQVAIDSLIASNGPVGICAIAIVGAPRDKEPNAAVWPCGHCRGIIWENCLGNKNVRILTVVSKDEVEISTIGELYPNAFGPEDLGIKIGA